MDHRSEQQTYRQGYSHTPSAEETVEAMPPWNEQGWQEQGQREQQQIYQTQTGQTFLMPDAANDGRLAAAFSYAGGWLSGLLFLLYGGQRRLVRFHALQSLLFFGLVNIIDIVLIIMMSVPRHFPPFLLWPGRSSVVPLFLGFLLFNFIAFVGWIVSIVQAANGKYHMLPIVGKMVSRRLQIPVILK